MRTRLADCHNHFLIQGPFYDFLFFSLPSYSTLTFNFIPYLLPRVRLSNGLTHEEAVVEKLQLLVAMSDVVILRKVDDLMPFFGQRFRQYMVDAAE